MIITENNCVDCPSELGCIGSACPYSDHEVHICDECKDCRAICSVDDYELCEDCAKKYLLNRFKELTIQEQANVLESDFSWVSI